MQSHDTVVLTRPLDEHGLAQGDVGAIVHAHDDGTAFEVEFVSGAGTTIAVVSLDANDLRPLRNSEILHVRQVPA